MLRTTLNKAYIKRTIRPLYGWTQATPKASFLDPAWGRGTAIFPGMVMVQNGAETWTLAADTGNTGPVGLSGLYIGGDGIDEPLESGINAIAVWVLGPDAEFEILAPAFGTFTGSEAPGTLLGIASGKLAPAGTQKVAKLISIGGAGASKIVVGGLTGTTA